MCDGLGLKNMPMPDMAELMFVGELFGGGGVN